MPIPWIAVLQSVPWTEVIKNAPKVADGAKKLWNTIGKKSPVPDVDAADDQSDISHEANTISTMQVKLAALEASVADLHEQMLASSEIIKSLADQNTQLITRVEMNRIQVRRLTGVIVIFSIVAISGFIISLFH